jgi:hypothetical protein
MRVNPVKAGTGATEFPVIAPTVALASVVVEWITSIMLSVAKSAQHWVAASAAPGRVNLDSSSRTCLAGASVAEHLVFARFVAPALVAVREIVMMAYLAASCAAS